MPGSGIGEDFVLSGGGVVAGDELRLIGDGHVVVRAGRIAQVGPGPGPDRLPRIDVTGCVVVPGLINAHTHLDDAALKELAFGVPSEVNLLFPPDGLRQQGMAALSRPRLVEAIRSAARRMLASGTVAVADYCSDGAAGVALVREAFEGSPVRCLAFASHSSHPLQSERALRGNRDGLTPGQLDDIEEALALADGFAPVHVNHTTDPALREIAALVRDRGKLLSTHASASLDYRATSVARTGVSDVTRAVTLLEPDFLVHLTTAVREELEEVVRANIPMVMCPRAMASLGRGLPPFAVAARLGGRIALGTDNAMITSPDLLEELAFLSRSIRAVSEDPSSVDARRLLATVTIDAARALGLDEELGSIVQGKSASLVIVDFDSDNLRYSVDPLASLVDRATAGDIRGVLVDGRLVHGSAGRRGEARSRLG